MSRRKGVFERYLEAIQKTGDIMLSWQYQKEMAMASMLSDADIDRIADEVISRLSITVNADEVFREIEELRRSIEELGR